MKELFWLASKRHHSNEVYAVPLIESYFGKAPWKAMEEINKPKNNSPLDQEHLIAGTWPRVLLYPEIQPYLLPNWYMTLQQPRRPNQCFHIHFQSGITKMGKKLKTLSVIILFNKIRKSNSNQYMTHFINYENASTDCSVQLKPNTITS